MSLFYFFLGIIIFSNIKIINLSCINSPLNPSKEIDCTKFNTDLKTCCFAQLKFSNNTIKNKCIEIEKNHTFALGFLDYITYENENNVQVSFSCDISHTTCGTNNPSELFQCREHSSLHYTCCMIDIDGDTDCILADTKFNSSTETFSLFNVATVTCNQSICKCKFDILFLLLSLFYF